MMIWWFFLKVLFLLFCNVRLNHGAFNMEELLGGFAKTKKANYDLPSTIVPVLYELTIKVDFFSIISYEGEVSINFKVKSRTNQVTLNSEGLNITSISILNDVSKLRLQNHTILENSQMLVINTKPSLTEDHVYTVRISFKNTLNEDEAGLYLRSFILQNQTQWIATTQFEPIYARRVFPCFDEPRFRTPFVLHLARQTEQDTLCNLPLLRTETDPQDKNITWDTFATQKAIPTYAISFMVSDFQLLKLTKNSKLRYEVKSIPMASSIEKQLSKKMKNTIYYIKTFTRIDMKEDAENYEIYTTPNSVNFELDDWEMRLYGNIAFYFPKKDPVQNKESMAMSIARQYSRKLITECLMRKHWGYAWWNEALISYIALRVAPEVEPHYRLSEYFVINTLQRSLMADVYVYPMTSLNSKPSSIIESYDSLAIQRGAAILNMLEHTVTPKIFQKALNRYLLEGNSTNTTLSPFNLYSIIDTFMPSGYQQLPITISNFMKLWTEGCEYPLISINTTKGEVDLKQDIYGSSSHAGIVEWVVPLTYTTKSRRNFDETTPKVWLFPRQEVRMGNILDRNDWIIFNVQATGYYRVNYDYENWRQIIQQLYNRFEDIDVINRAQLVDDVLHLAIDEKIDFHMAFTLTNYLKNEYDLLPWITAMNVFKNLILTYDQTSASISLRNYILDIFQNIYKSIGFFSSRSDSYEVKISRPEFVYMACNLKLSDCVENALEEFNKNIKDLSRIDLDLRETIFCTAAKHFNQTEVWTHLWHFYKSCIYDYERTVIIRSFKCFEDIAILKKILYKINDQTNGLTYKDRNDAYKSVFLSKGGTRACLQYLEEVLSENNAVYSSNTLATINYIISNIIIGNRDQLNLIQSLLSQVNEINQTDYQGLVDGLRDKFRESKESLSFIEGVVHEINSAIANINPSMPTLIKRKTLKERAETYVRREIDSLSGKQLAKNVFYNYLGPKVFGKYFRYISLLNFLESPIPYEKVIIAVLKRIKLPNLFHQNGQESAPPSHMHYDD